MATLKQELVNYIKAQGVDLRVNTKARGNLGLFANNRIDIHKKLDDNKFIEVLLHEYAHFVHKNLENDMPRTGGSLRTLFDVEDDSLIREELLKVTHFVDENALLKKIDSMKNTYKLQIKSYEENIRQEYPGFLRSKQFKPFEKFIKHSDAKYLLSYDKVRLVTPFLRRVKNYSIETIEQDFPNMPMSFVNYIKICSLSRKSKNLQKRKNKLKKYYERPNELFARFIQGLYLHNADIKRLAPYSYERFFDLLSRNYYGDLSKIIAFLYKDSL